MSSTELRHRSAATNQTEMSNDKTFKIREAGTGLSAKSMLNTSPPQHGVVLKLHIPILFTLLPEFIQRIILSLSFLSFLAPAWKQRYLILCGSYLYKFADQSSKVPKGSPFDLETLSIDMVGNELTSELGVLPAGYSTVFSVSTLRRKHYYAVADSEEAALWVRSLKESRQETIKRSMGHAGNMPYPQAWSYFDGLGKGLIKTKARIRARMEDTKLREIEMSSFSDAGPMPRGYYS